MLYIAIMEFFIPAIWNYALCLGVWRRVASKSHKYLVSQTFTASYPIIPKALPKKCDAYVHSPHPTLQREGMLFLLLGLLHDMRAFRSCLAQGQTCTRAHSLVMRRVHPDSTTCHSNVLVSRARALNSHCVPIFGLYCAFKPSTARSQV